MEEIIKALREFDAKRNWNEYDLVQTEEQTIEALYKSLVHLMGEIGEFANELKKCRRDNNFNEQNLKEELVDTFIFLQKIALTLKMDLKEETLRKISINEERFKHFIKDGN